jgi:bacillithiol biosynthesis deacetylase BshB1
MATLLAIGAHPDDIEIGIGGTLRKAIREGHRVVAVDLTDGEPTPYGSREIRTKETARANAILGITDRRCLGLPNRVLMDGVDARRALATVMREVRPDVLFTHVGLDAHPDHVAAFEITRGAVLLSRIVKIDLPHEPWRPGPVHGFLSSHLRHAYQPSFVLGLGEEDHEAKIEAVLAYESQFVRGRHENWARNLLTARAEYFGSLGRVRYGEPIVSEEVPGLWDVLAIAGAGAANTPKPSA